MIKKISIILAIVGVLAFVIGITFILYAIIGMQNQGGSIGIIGGADEPTHEFMFYTVIHSWMFALAAIGFLVMIASAAVAIVCRSTRKG